MNAETSQHTFSDNVTELTELSDSQSTFTSALSPSHPAPSCPPSPPPTPPVPAIKHPMYSPAAPDNLDAIKDSRIDSLARMQRADSFLRSLTPEQSRQIFQWVMELDNICEAHSRITAPPPEGLGLTVSTSTLRRLRSHWQALDEVHFTENMLDIITDMELASELTQPARIQNAICHLLQQKAFDLARTVPGSEVMKDLLAGIEKLSTLDLKRQKLALERERFQRATSPAPAPTQHHRVDLNIVPPATHPAKAGATPSPHPRPGPQPQSPVLATENSILLRSAAPPALLPDSVATPSSPPKLTSNPPNHQNAE